MINQTISIREYVIDIYTHAFISIALMTFIFIFAAIKRFRKDIVTTFTEVIDEINLSNYVNKTDKVNDDIRLNNLENIYKNGSYYDDQIGSNINLSLYTQLTIFTLTVVIVCYISNMDVSFWRNFFHEKIIYFGILLSLEYIFYETVVNEYEDILKGDVYNIFKNNINDLS